MGLDGKSFWVCKFRSMYVDAEERHGPGLGARRRPAVHAGRPVAARARPRRAAAALERAQRRHVAGRAAARAPVLRRPVQAPDPAVHAAPQGEGRASPAGRRSTAGAATPRSRSGSSTTSTTSRTGRSGLDFKIIWLTAGARASSTSTRTEHHRARHTMSQTCRHHRSRRLHRLALAETLLDRGYSVIGIDNLLTGDIANIAHLARPRLPVHQARRHQLHLRRRPGGLRAALGQPGQPDRLPGAADPDAEGRRAGHAQGARPGQGEEARGSSSPRRRRCTATRSSTRRGDLLGQRQPDRPARRLRRGQALRRGDDDGLPPLPRRGHEDRPHLQHLRPAHAGERRARGARRSSRQALRDEDVTVFGDGSQTRSFCYVSDLVDGIIRLMQSDVNEPVNIGNPHEMTIERDRADDHADDRLDEPDRLQAAARRTTRRCASPTSRARARCSAGSRRCRSSRASSTTIAYFKTRMGIGR